MSGLAFPKRLASVDRHKRRADLNAALAAAYAEADLRDGPYCRVTGRYTQPWHVNPQVRREHHHLQSRSSAPERVTDSTNIVVCCAEAHKYFKVGWLVSEGTDARGVVRFQWTELATSRPFRIQSRCWSQQDEE